jgi:hypothetical protein
MSGTEAYLLALIFAASPVPSLGLALRANTAVAVGQRENSTFQQLEEGPRPVHEGALAGIGAVNAAEIRSIQLAANIAFMHVPRTGGDSFFDALNASAAANHLSLFPPSDLVHSWTAPGCTQTGGVAGSAHCTYSELHACLDKGARRNDLKFVTVLREPVARTISEFYWWTRKSAGSHGGLTSAQRFWNIRTAEEAEHGLLAWARDPRNNAFNRQVKYLAMVAPDPASRHSCITTDYDAYVAYWTARYDCNADEIEERVNADRSLLEDAKKAIEDRFLYVGLTDAFEQSVEELQTALGVSTPYARSPSHNSPSYERPSKAIEELVRERNALDAELYAYVVERNGKLFHHRDLTRWLH